MIRGYIFDLDGVLVDTAKFHYLALKRLAKEKFGYDFTIEQNEAFKGVNRVACMKILCGLADVQLSRGLTWHTLERANPTADLTHVQAGESICVPAENIPCDLPRSLVLCADDTLDTLALKYNLSVGALLRANPCLAPADFVPGTTITLPQ